MEGATHFIEQRVINGYMGFSSIKPYHKLEGYRDAILKLVEHGIFYQYKPIAIFLIKPKPTTNEQ